MLTLKAAGPLPIWLEEMSDRAREAYFQEHPDSKYRKQTERNTENRRRRQEQLANRDRIHEERLEKNKPIIHPGSEQLAKRIMEGKPIINPQYNQLQDLSTPKTQYLFKHLPLNQKKIILNSYPERLTDEQIDNYAKEAFKDPSEIMNLKNHGSTPRKLRERIKNPETLDMMRKSIEDNFGKHPIIMNNVKKSFGL